MYFHTTFQFLVSCMSSLNHKSFRTPDKSDSWFFQTLVDSLYITLEISQREWTPSIDCLGFDTFCFSRRRSFVSLLPKPTNLFLVKRWIVLKRFSVWLQHKPSFIYQYRRVFVLWKTVHSLLKIVGLHIYNNKVYWKPYELNYVNSIK